MRRHDPSATPRYAPDMPAWGPPLIGAGSTIFMLNLALAIQRLKATRGWAIRFAVELRRWDGRLPEHFDAHIAP